MYQTRTDPTPRFAGGHDGPGAAGPTARADAAFGHPSLEVRVPSRSRLGSIDGRSNVPSKLIMSSFAPPPIDREMHPSSAEGELKLTILMVWRSPSEAVDCLCHAGPLPPIPSPPIKVEVRGAPRHNAKAKDSQWVRCVECRQTRGREVPARSSQHLPTHMYPHTHTPAHEGTAKAWRRSSRPT